jgi:phospholipid transport system substrate-binding protein
MSRFVFVIVALTLSLGALAQELGAGDLVRKMTDEVMSAIKADTELAAGDRQKAIKLVQEKVLPYIDFEEAARLAVGRSWRQATPEQKAKLVVEFRQMLVRTYTNALGTYRGQTLKVLPARSKDAAPDETTVHTQYIRSTGQPLPVDFRMHKVGAGWKVFDFVVEGVSLVLTYRSEFDVIVKQQGIDGLILRLGQKNAPA